MNAQIHLQTAETAFLREKTAEMAVSDQLQHTRESLLTDEVFRLREKVKSLQELCTVYEDQVRVEALREKTRLFRSRKALSMRVSGSYKGEEGNKSFGEGAEQWKQLKTEVQGLAAELGCKEGDSVWENWAFLRSLLLKRSQEGHCNGQKPTLSISLRPASLAAAFLLIQRSSALAARMWSRPNREYAESRQGKGSAVDFPL